MADPLDPTLFNNLKDGVTVVNEALFDQLKQTIDGSFASFGPVDHVPENSVLGRPTGAGPAETIPLGEYVAVHEGKLDVAGAGETAFIVQNKPQAIARLSQKLGRQIPPNYLPYAQSLHELPTGYMRSTAGSGVIATVATIPASDVEPVTLPARTLSGRGSASDGPEETLTIGTGLEIQGTTLVATAQNSGLYGYGFSVQTTEPPSARTARLNAPHPYTASTKLWITFQNSNGEDLYFEWMGVPVGSVLLVQDKDTHGQFAELTVMASPIDKGSYCEFAVAWKANGTALATQDCLVRTHTGGVLAALEARLAALEAALRREDA